MVSFAPGGFLGFSARGRLGRWINLATLGLPGWGLSHVAAIARSPESGDPLLVYESTTTATHRCWRKKVLVAGVQAHPAQQRVDEYNGHVWYYEPKTKLTGIDLLIFTNFLESKLGVPYDKIGAIRSSDLALGKLWQWVLSTEDLASLFCSELLAAALRTVNLFESKNASVWNPNRIGRAATIGWPFASWGAKPCFCWPQKLK